MLNNNVVDREYLKTIIDDRFMSWFADLYN